MHRPTQARDSASLPPAPPLGGWRSRPVVAVMRGLVNATRTQQDAWYRHRLLITVDTCAHRPRVRCEHDSQATGRGMTSIGCDGCWTCRLLGTKPWLYKPVWTQRDCLVRTPVAEISGSSCPCALIWTKLTSGRHRHELTAVTRQHKPSTVSSQLLPYPSVDLSSQPRALDVLDQSISS